ncbi:hypothetical protein HAX54_002588 [Datura stramonium]|uniref:Uncharacterized protein n=1 Tax=Datura stramonium TaxID=4076 RepID=A0ABS8T5A6_DATST|nr:hypothetical protein [Datura stramonium]
MQRKFQPTKSGAQRRNVRTETTHHLRDKNTESEEEVQEIGTKKPSPVYQTRSIAKQQDATPQSDEGADSSTNGSSSSDVDSDLEEESSNEATSSLVGDFEPIRGNVLKAKTPGFRESLRRQVKGAKKYFQEGHSLKCKRTSQMQHC